VIQVGLIDENNRGSKISWNCPFKGNINQKIILFIGKLFVIDTAEQKIGDFKVDYLCEFIKQGFYSYIRGQMELLDGKIRGRKSLDAILLRISFFPCTVLYSISFEIRLLRIRMDLKSLLLLQISSIVELEPRSRTILVEPESESNSDTNPVQAPRAPVPKLMNNIDF
jgi:hypothetical protein